MSRPIKFRVYDKETEQYLPISNGISDGVIGITTNGNHILYLEDGEVNIDYVNTYIIEQDTGLKDQYGKKIFEGEIIKIAEDIAGYVIQDANGQWVIFCDNKEPVKVDMTLGELSKIPKLDLGNTLAKEYCSIVGNIHENPELLGGENE